MKKNEIREWTIMVYLAGDNNLSSECVFALNEMKSVIGLDKFYLIAQFDPSDAFIPTHRYWIRDDGKVTTLQSDIFDEARFNARSREVHFRDESGQANKFARARFRERGRVEAQIPPLARLASLGTAPDPSDTSLDETDTASPITLYNFLSFCMDRFPAKHYMPVIMGHGAGTQRDYLLRDTTPAGYLTLNELKQVFKQLRNDRNKPIEVLGMDNCLMSMAEVSYELRESVEVIVGCESYSPASGWPFREILTRLKDELAKSLKPGQNEDKRIEVEFATAIVEEYTKYYANYWLGGLSVAQSAMDLNQAGALKLAVDALANGLVNEIEREELREAAKPREEIRRYPFRDALVLAHWEAQSFNGERFTDLFDFCDCLERRYRDGRIPELCKNAKSAISNFVLKACYNGAAYQYSYGVSVYFPWSQVANSYRNLDFVRSRRDDKLHGWGKFLEVYTAKTRREPRGMAEALVQLAPQSAAFARRSAAVQGLVMKTTDMKTTDMKTTDMKTSDMGGGNDICSMRNPPIVFLPDECIGQTESILQAEVRLLAPTEEHNGYPTQKEGAAAKEGGVRRRGVE